MIFFNLKNKNKQLSISLKLIQFEINYILFKKNLNNFLILENF